MEYELIHDFKENRHHQLDFFSLIKRVEKTESYEDWMIRNRWDENFIPFALVDEKGAMVAALGVHRMNVCVNERKYLSIQIGEVFVKSGYESLDLELEILNRIIKRYENIVDVIYSFDDKTKICTFLKKKGFVETEKYRYSIEWNPKTKNESSNVRRIDLEDPNEQERLLEEIKHSSRVSKTMSVTGDALLKNFNIMKYYPRNVFHVPALDTIVVSMIVGRTFKLIDVFSKHEYNLQKLLDIIVPSNVESVEFGFIPTIPNLEITKNFATQSRHRYLHSSSLYIKPISIPIHSIDFKIPALPALIGEKKEYK